MQNLQEDVLDVYIESIQWFFTRGVLLVQTFIVLTWQTKVI